MTPSLYQNDLFVLIHGLSSSKDEWFTTHKKLTDYFTSNSITFIALDLYGHGSYSADEPNFNNEYIDDDLWPIFIDKSVNNYLKVISIEDQKNRSFNGIHLMSYSVGSVIAIELAKHLSTCKSLSLSVPNPDYSINDSYSLCNVIGKLNKLRINIFSGTKDEEVPYKDIETLIRENKNINLHSDYAGHLLPNQWIDDLLNDFE